MKQHTLNMVRFSILLAIEAIFCFTPLGSLPALGPIVATLAMVPVVLTALLLGTRAGTAMGAIAGLFSLIVWTFTPPNPLAAFVFTPFYSYGEFQGNFGSLLICLVPRILTGTVSGGLYRLLSQRPGKDALHLAISAAVGSLVNTFGVMGGIWLFFGRAYASLAGQAMVAIVGLTIVSSGIPEAVLCGIVAPAVCRPVQRILSRQQGVAAVK